MSFGPSAESTSLSEPASTALTTAAVNQAFQDTVQDSVEKSTLASSLPERFSAVQVASSPPSHLDNPSQLDSHSKQALEAATLEDLIATAVEQLTIDDFHGRWSSAKQFSKQFSQWGDRAIPPLIHHLHAQSDPEIQWFMVRILAQFDHAQFDHAQIVTALAQLLMTTQSEDLQMEVIKALSSMGGSAIRVLSQLLSAVVDDAQRILAARTLAHIRRSAVIEPLLSITKDANADLRMIAVEALGSFHDPRVTPVLLEAIADKPSICIEAIRTLGRRSDLLTTTDLITPLQQCLVSDDETIACESAIALSRLGNTDATQLLGKQLFEPLSTKVKVTIAQSLGWLNTAESVAHLASAFAMPIPIIMPTVKQAIAQALGQTRELALQAIAAQPLIAWLSEAPTRTALETVSETELAKGLTPETFLLTQTVLAVLPRLNATEALTPIIPLLGNSAPRLRMHALSAIKQLDPRASQAQVQRYLRREDLPLTRKQYVAQTLAAW